MKPLAYLSLIISLHLFPIWMYGQEYPSHSFTIGLEAYRPSSVAPTKVASSPIAVRFFQGLTPTWRLALTLGWEEYEETGIDEVNLQREWFTTVGGSGIMTMNEVTTISDQVVSFSVGPRYIIPGGPPRIRMIVGGDLLGAYFPERTVIIDSKIEQVGELGEVLTFAESQAIGRGYAGVGFGIQGSIGVEGIIADGLIIGMEFGPGRFARFREVVHTFREVGLRQVTPVMTEPMPVENEFERSIGEEQESQVRLRGMIYLGWEF